MIDEESFSNFYELIPSLLEALCHISREQPAHVLNSGALTHIFRIIDFYTHDETAKGSLLWIFPPPPPPLISDSLSLVSAVEIMLHVISRFNIEHYNLVKPYFQNLVDKFRVADGSKKDVIRDNILIIFLVLLEVYASDKTKLEELTGCGILLEVVKYISKEN